MNGALRLEIRLQAMGIAEFIIGRRGACHRARIRATRWRDPLAPSILRAPNKEAPAGHADACFAVSSDGGTGQPGAAPCVAVYTA
jgi:hypothetical protein